MLLKKSGSNDEIAESTCECLLEAAFLADLTKALYAPTWAATRARQ